MIPYDKRSGKIWYNSEFIDWADAKIHVLNHGLHYASCVFEGERVYDGTIFKLEEHTARLFYSAKWMGMIVPYSETEINDACHKIITVQKIDNGYVKEFNGPDLQFGEYTKFTEIDDGDLPSLQEYEDGVQYSLAQLDERNGASDAVVEGHVFNIREGSGLIFRDKDTNRLVRNGDDRKNADPDLRIKMIFDDGSGSCTAYLNREITEQVLGRDLDSCLEFVKENFGPEALVEEIEDALLLKPLKLRGFASSDEYGLSFVARSCEAATELDVPNAARQFLAALEG